MVGAKDRDTGQVATRVIERTDGATLNSFVDTHGEDGAKVYTDGSSVDRGH